MVLVDDHDLVRQGVATLLKLDHRLDVVGQGASAAEALAMSDSVEADVLLVDVSLGDGSGIDVAREFRRRHPRMGIVMLTMHDDDDTLFAALDAGASALVHKSDSAADVIAAVHRCAHAPGSFSAPGLAGALRRRESAPPVTLTTREHDVLTRLADGASIAETARGLELKPSTVKTHIEHIYRKLGAVNRAGAVMSAIRLGLIPSPS